MEDVGLRDASPTYIRREVRKPRRAVSPHDFVFRATRFNAFIGMVYEFVTLFRRKEQR